MHKYVKRCTTEVTKIIIFMLFLFVVYVIMFIYNASVTVKNLGWFPNTLRTSSLSCSQLDMLIVMPRAIRYILNLSFLIKITFVIYLTQVLDLDFEV